jgi:Ca2+/Na+ antiporter
MKIEDETMNNTTFQRITLPDEDVPVSILRLVVTIVVTGFICFLVVIDQLLGLWPFGMYWILLALGVVVCCVLLWILLKWNEEHQQEGAETFLKKWGEELGWPLMILAFTIQFFIPTIRPTLLGVILGGSWFLVWWNRQKKR